MTVLDVLNATTPFFAKHGISSPRLTVELILAEILQKTRMQLYLEHDRVLDDAVLDRMRPLVKRRSEGEPLEYVLGVTTFAGHRVQVTPDVLVPRPETEILLEAAVELIDPAGLPVLEIATGSGVLALSLAKKFPELEIVATDVSAAALAVARRNGEGCGKIRFVKCDLMESAALPERCQIIVANLPYIPSSDIESLPREVRHEPRLALDGGADGMDLIRRLTAQSAGRTRYLALELGDGQAEVAKTLCLSAGYALIKLLPDFTERARVLVVEYHG